MARTYWTDDVSRKLLTILNEEKARGVSKFCWSKITTNLNVQTGLNLSTKQVINHHGDLSKKFKCWEELQNMSGISFDPVTKKIAVDEKSTERYNAFLEVNLYFK